MARASILIVDSDSELVQIIASLLNFQGYRVNFTSRVREAATKLSLQKYHCILIDPDLPGERGESILRTAMDPSGLNAKTPVVIATANSTYEIPVDVLANVRAVIAKPFSIEEIYGALLATEDSGAHSSKSAS